MKKNTFDIKRMNDIKNRNNMDNIRNMNIPNNEDNEKKYSRFGKLDLYGAWFFIISGLSAIICIIVFNLGLSLKKQNYHKEYVYKDSGMLYYENDGNKIYINKIYDWKNEIFSPKIPNKKTVIMYCLNNNDSECIYFNKSIMQSVPAIYISLFILTLGISYLFAIKNEHKEIEESDIKVNFGDSFIFYLVIVGISLMCWQSYKAIKYFKLKDENNIVNATIYSSLYNESNEGNKKKSYKYLAYYYVNNKKYIFVNDMFQDGYIEDHIGETVELYYDKNNPSNASKKNNPVDYLWLFVGLILTLIFLPFVFFKKKTRNITYKLNKVKETIAETIDETIDEKLDKVTEKIDETMDKKLR